MGRDRAGQLVVGTFLYIPFFSIVLPDLNPYDNSLAVYNLWWWPGGHRLNSTLPLLLFLLCKIEWKEENTIANVELFQLLVCQRVLGNLTILCGNLTHQSFRILPPSIYILSLFFGECNRDSWNISSDLMDDFSTIFNLSPASSCV